VDCILSNIPLFVTRNLELLVIAYKRSEKRCTLLTNSSSVGVKTFD